jgi:hypothetical protein
VRQWAQEMLGRNVLADGDDRDEGDIFLKVFCCDGSIDVSLFGPAKWIDFRICWLIHYVFRYCSLALVGVGNADSIRGASAVPRSFIFQGLLEFAVMSRVSKGYYCFVVRCWDYM